MITTQPTQPAREGHGRRATHVPHRSDTRAGADPRRGILRPANRPRTAYLATAVGGLAVIAFGFVMRAFPIDASLVTDFNRDHVGAWGFIADAVYRVLSPGPAIVLVVAVALLVWWRSRSLVTALAFGGTVAAVWLPVAAIKILVDRPRPDPATLLHVPAQLQTDGSFPSGHTGFAIAFAAGIWFLLRDSRWEGVAIVGGVLLTALVGAAVVCDGLHHPSDVLGSIAWGFAAAPSARILVADVALSRISARLGR